MVYIKKFNSQAVIKRLGFLLDILQIETKIKDDLQYLRTDSIVLLDTELPKSGKIVSKWSIRKGTTRTTSPTITRGRK